MPNLIKKKMSLSLVIARKLYTMLFLFERNILCKLNNILFYQESDVFLLNSNKFCPLQATQFRRKQRMRLRSLG